MASQEEMILVDRSGSRLITEEDVMLLNPIQTTTSMVIRRQLAEWALEDGEANGTPSSFDILDPETLAEATDEAWSKLSSEEQSQVQKNARSFLRGSAQIRAEKGLEANRQVCRVFRRIYAARRALRMAKEHDELPTTFDAYGIYDLRMYRRELISKLRPDDLEELKEDIRTAGIRRRVRASHGDRT